MYLDIEIYSTPVMVGGRMGEDGKEQKGWRGKEGGRVKRKEEGDELRDVCIIFISLLLPQGTCMQHETLT